MGVKKEKDVYFWKNKRLYESQIGMCHRLLVIRHKSNPDFRLSNFFVIESHSLILRNKGTLFYSRSSVT